MMLNIAWIIIGVAGCAFVIYAIRNEIWWDEYRFASEERKREMLSKVKFNSHKIGYLMMFVNACFFIYILYELINLMFIK